jgi:serine O-acetyltransferase
MQLTWRETRQILGADVARYADSHTPGNLLLLALKKLYSHPSLAGVIYYRIGRWLWLSRRRPLHAAALILYRALYPLVRMYSGVELSPRAQIEAGLCIMHFGPTIIHANVMAGKNLTLMHGVTIGAAKTGIPRLGDNVAIGIGAAVIGSIVIGSNVHIGAGAVVTKDLPDNCTAVGIPAQPIKIGSSD